MDHQRAVQNLAVESYLLGDMSAEEREAFEEHFFECSVCGEDVRAAAEFMEDAKKILGETSRPLAALPQTAKISGQRATPGWLDWLKPQFAAPALAALLLLVGYQSLRTIPSLRNQVEASNTPRSVPSVVLRPSVRGDSTNLKAAPGESVMLMLDFSMPPAAGTPLQFFVESAEDGSGKELLRIDGVAPEPGRFLNLMIPHPDLRSGLYIVVAEIAAKPPSHGQELGKYPFRLELQEGAERSK
jgi:hypothetical protein